MRETVTAYERIVCDRCGFELKYGREEGRTLLKDWTICVSIPYLYVSRETGFESGPFNDYLDLCPSCCIEASVRELVALAVKREAKRRGEIEEADHGEDS